MSAVRRVPFMLPENTCLVHVKLGRIRFLGHLGDWVLRFVDEAGNLVRIPLESSNELVMTTVPWVIAEFHAGRLHDPVYAEAGSTREGRFLGLDRAACVARDPRCAYRWGWGMAALEAGLQYSEAQIKAWLPTARPVGHPDDPVAISKMLAVTPPWRSLIRFMKRLRTGGLEIGSCVNGSGRQEGEGQLSEIEDRLIENVALQFNSNPLLATADDAAALCVRYWQEMKASGVDGLRAAPPTAEAIRLRIIRTENPTTRAMRQSPGAARRFFDAHGEPVGSERPFERAYVDGVEFEHACTFSDDWPIPSNKMKAVFVMDDFSQYVFPGRVFTGPFRGEIGIDAVMNAMIPPDLSEDEIAADPERAMHYGSFSDTVYDNDKTMIRPGVVPNATTVVSTIELAEIYGHDVKSKLENFFPFLKRKLRGVKGRILMPRILRDIRIDPIASAEVTRAVYAYMVEMARREWNNKPKKSLGDLSPSQVLNQAIGMGVNRLTDPGKMRRAFARTPDRLGSLTTNGLVYDGITYRFNREGVGEILASRHRHTPFYERLAGSAKVLVPMRVWDGNIDSIDILDESTGKFHRLWSTVPHYTGGLTRWEHAEYRKYCRDGSGETISELERLRAKSKHIVGFDDAMPKAAFQARERMAALLEGEEARAAAGVRGRNPNYGRLPECGLVADVGGVNREDRATPPPGTRDPEDRNEEHPPVKRDHLAPPRPPGYGMAFSPFPTIPEDHSNADQDRDHAASVPSDGRDADGERSSDEAADDGAAAASEQQDLLGGRSVHEAEERERLRRRWGASDDE